MLVHDFRGSEIAGEAQSPGDAERALQRAPDLRGQALGEGSSFHLDEDRLNDQLVPGSETQLDGAVAAGFLAGHCKGLHLPALFRQAAAERAGEHAHPVEVRVEAHVDLLEELAPAVRFFPGLDRQGLKLFRQKTGELERRGQVSSTVRRR